jgi:hypothetical protein
MDPNRATDRNGFSWPLPQPVLLAPVETKQVAGGSPYIPIPPAYTAAHIHPYSPYIPVPPS